MAVLNCKWSCGILFSQKNSFEIFFLYVHNNELCTPQKDITSHLIKIDSLTFSNQIYILTGTVQFPPFLITLFLPMFFFFPEAFVLSAIFFSHPFLAKKLLLPFKICPSAPVALLRNHLVNKSPQLQQCDPHFFPSWIVDIVPVSFAAP